MEDEREREWRERENRSTLCEREGEIMGEERTEMEETSQS